MSTGLIFDAFKRPHRPVADVPADISDAFLRIARPKDSASPRADPIEARAQPAIGEPYFEIYRAERVTLTSILFSGGDWRWCFRSAMGEPIAVSVGYASEQECAAAVAALRRGAGAAKVRVGHNR